MLCLVQIVPQNLKKWYLSKGSRLNATDCAKCCKIASWNLGFWQWVHIKKTLQSIKISLHDHGKVIEDENLKDA